MIVDVCIVFYAIKGFLFCDGYSYYKFERDELQLLILNSLPQLVTDIKYNIFKTSFKVQARKIDKLQRYNRLYSIRNPGLKESKSNDLNYKNKRIIKFLLRMDPGKETNQVLRLEGLSDDESHYTSKQKDLNSDITDESDLLIQTLINEEKMIEREKNNKNKDETPDLNPIDKQAPFMVYNPNIQNSPPPPDNTLVKESNIDLNKHAQSLKSNDDSLTLPPSEEMNGMSKLDPSWVDFDISIYNGTDKFVSHIQDNHADLSTEKKSNLLLLLLIGYITINHYDIHDNVVIMQEQVGNAIGDYICDRSSFDEKTKKFKYDRITLVDLFFSKI